MGGRRQEGESESDGGGPMRPRYLALQAPSPPTPNGHRGGERRSAYGVPESPRTHGERGRLMLALLAAAGVLLGLAAALLAWALWRLAVAGG